MEALMLHKQRCETCKFYGEDNETCSHPTWINDGIILLLGAERYEFVEEMGCASWEMLP